MSVVGNAARGLFDAVARPRRFVERQVRTDQSGVVTATRFAFLLTVFAGNVAVLAYQGNRGSAGPDFDVIAGEAIVFLFTGVTTIFATFVLGLLLVARSFDPVRTFNTSLYAVGGFFSMQLSIELSMVRNPVGEPLSKLREAAAETLANGLGYELAATQVQGGRVYASPATRGQPYYPTVHGEVFPWEVIAADVLASSTTTVLVSLWLLSAFYLVYVLYLAASGHSAVGRTGAAAITGGTILAYFLDLAFYLNPLWSYDGTQIIQLLL